MKDAIVGTVDFIAYSMFFVVGLVGAITLTTGNVTHGVIILVAGWLVSCLICGTWFVLSSIAENSKQTTLLLKRLLDKE